MIFLKYIGNLYIFHWASKNVHAVLKCFVIFIFFLKYFSHISPVIALNVFSTWIITKIKLAGWYLWKEFQDELNHEETITKKALNFFMTHMQGFSHFRQLLQNHGLKEMRGFPSSLIYSVKNLRSTALWFWGTLQFGKAYSWTDFWVERIVFWQHSCICSFKNCLNILGLFLHRRALPHGGVNERWTPTSL